MQEPTEVSSAVKVKEAPKASVLLKFLSVRGLKSKSLKLTAEALSKTYTQRRYVEKTLAQRAALREPDDVFSESTDAYVPKKRVADVLNLHQDEEQVNQVFLMETRALSFERQALDKVVCDREENREEFEERLWQWMVKDRGLQQVADDSEETQKEEEPAQEEQ